MAVADLRRLGDAVRSARRRAGMTQAQLGEPYLSKSFVSQVEHGAVAPSLPSLFHIARQLDVSPVQLVALADGQLHTDTLFTLAEAALVMDGSAASAAWLAPLAHPPLAAADRHNPRRRAREHRLEGLRQLVAGEARLAVDHLQQALQADDVGEALLTRYWLGVAQQAAQRPVAAAEAWQQVAATLPKPTSRRAPFSPAPADPIPAPGPSVTACLRSAAWLRLAHLYEAIGDRDAATRARREAAAEPAIVAALEAGPPLARLLWLAAVEAYQRADLSGAAACARLVPLLMSATRWAPTPPAPS